MVTHVFEGRVQNEAWLLPGAGKAARSPSPGVCPCSPPPTQLRAPCPVSRVSSSRTFLGHQEVPSVMKRQKQRGQGSEERRADGQPSPRKRAGGPAEAARAGRTAQRRRPSHQPLSRSRRPQRAGLPQNGARARLSIYTLLPASLCIPSPSIPFQNLPPAPTV